MRRSIAVQAFTIKFSLAVAAAMLALSVAGAAIAQDQAKIGQGKKDFETYCADCHGANGKGNGVAGNLVSDTPPPDLTVLARRNGGVFPTEAITDLIDGRKRIPSHERLEMPFWGVTLQRPGEEFSPQSNAEVKQRIDAIVGYIRSIQQK
ncbi:MAG TPA: cytochrome c [Candidatus Binataceae bacterium]|nr:cytochrome c [Candidatus Binataceae bacterium]